MATNDTKTKNVAGLASALQRADALLCWLETTFLGTLVLFCSGLLLLNVILRYIFLAPISWAEELSLYLMAWLVFVGCSVAIRTRGHIAVDLLPLALSPANRRRLALLVGLLILVFLTVFFYFSALHTLRVYDAKQVTPVMLAPMWLTYLCMPVASVLMFLRTCQVMWRTLRPQGAADTEPAVSLRD